jgi:Flp pilus assembly pilin Flp
MKLSRPSKILNNQGQGLTEYITLVLLIAIVSIAATKTLGTRIKSKITEASDHINKEISLEN